MGSVQPADAGLNAAAMEATGGEILGRMIRDGRRENGLKLEDMVGRVFEVKFDPS